MEPLETYPSLHPSNWTLYGYFEKNGLPDESAAVLQALDMLSGEHPDFLFCRSVLCHIGVPIARAEPVAKTFYIVDGDKRHRITLRGLAEYAEAAGGGLAIESSGPVLVKNPENTLGCDFRLLAGGYTPPEIRLCGVAIRRKTGGFVSIGVNYEPFRHGYPVISPIRSEAGCIVGEARRYMSDVKQAEHDMREAYGRYSRDVAEPAHSFFRQMRNRIEDMGYKFIEEGAKKRSA